MKPILFNTDMVRAILADRKSVTRRVVKPQPEKSAYSPYDGVGGRVSFRIGERGCTDPYKPPYRRGDILYVRETFSIGADGYVYKADELDSDGWGWRPSIHMPREAARLFLRVTDVRVERLQDITDDDLVRDFGFCLDAIKAVGRDALAAPFWNSTIKKADLPLYGWDANPYVWVIGFERCEKPKGD